MDTVDLWSAASDENIKATNNFNINCTMDTILRGLETEELPLKEGSFCKRTQISAAGKWDYPPSLAKARPKATRPFMLPPFQYVLIIPGKHCQGLCFADPPQAASHQQSCMLQHHMLTQSSSSSIHSVCIYREQDQLKDP